MKVMAIERFTTTLPTGHSLSLCLGDITAEEVDAIVNAANSGLAHGGGVAGAIVRKGGSIIQEECDRLGRVKTGQAALTSAGKLPAKFVIHAVGSVWGGQSPEESDRLLTSAITSSLEIARERNLISIAFPAISSGIFGYPKIRCAQVIVGALYDWAIAHHDDNPRDLRIVIIDQATMGFFETEVDSRFGKRQ